MSVRALRLAFPVACVLVGLGSFLGVGCGGDDGATPTDAAGGTAGSSGSGGAGGSSGAGTSSVSIPPPSLPVLTPCPSGWKEIPDDDGPVVCEPGPLSSWACPPGWAAESVLSATPQAFSICIPPAPATGCAMGTMPVLGETTCVPIGDECPSDEWPADLPTAGVVYVRGGSVNGDGSKAAPFGTIQKGIAAASPGATVAIAKGTYAELLSISKRVELRGACVTGVTVEGSPAKEVTDRTINLTSTGDLTLRNLTVSGARWGVFVLGGKLDATGIRIAGAAGFGVVLTEGASARLEALEIVDTEADLDGGFGRGLEVDNGARVDASRLYVARIRCT
jgi:hypothetical protein